MFGRPLLRDNQRVISHRGAGLLAPENTLSSITQARNLGFHNIHFDVHLTADGIPVLSAQDTLNTLDNINGPISEQFFDQINRVDVGSWFGNEFSDEKIATLYQAINVCKTHDILPVIQLCPEKKQDESIARICANMIQENWGKNDSPPILISASESTLLTLMKENPDIPRGLVWSDTTESDEKATEGLTCNSVWVNGNRVSIDLVNALHKRGIFIVATNIASSIDALDLIELQIDALMTNTPDVIGPNFI